MIAAIALLCCVVSCRSAFTEEPVENAVEEPERAELLGASNKQHRVNGILRQRALIKAARSGNLAEIEKQLEAGADINGIDEDLESTALMWAAKVADAKTVKFLIDAGADVNFENGHGETALQQAMGNANHRVEIVRALVDAGARPTAQKDPQAWWLSIYGSALTHRAELEIFKSLLDAGLDVNPATGSPLGRAIGHGRADVVQLLLSRGAEVKESGRGRTLLMAAATSPSGRYADPVQTVRLVLELGANVNQRDEDGRTALHCAAESQNSATGPIMKLLIEAGAELEVADWKWGMTPLMVAADFGWDASPLQVLIGAGANGKARDKLGNTPLHWCVRPGWWGADLSKVDRLVQSEALATINAVNELGWTPLMEACRTGDAGIVEYLLRKGADPNAQNHEGWTPLMIAVGSSGSDVWREWIRRDAEWLEQREGFAEKDVWRLYGVPDFEAISTFGQVGRVWTLLTYGARPDAKAKDGTTVQTLLAGRHDASAAAIRKLLELDVIELVRRQKEAEREARRHNDAQRRRESPQPDVEPETMGVKQ